jgi:hypothetical protein
LEAMGAEDLREAVREILVELDDRAHARVVNSLIGRAARGDSGWAPATVRDQDVAEVLSFVRAARRVGYADPSDVDEYLHRGVAAFLGKHYAAAKKIFGALLPPIADADIDLGQHELVDEVLGVDAAECVAQYLVATYMTAHPEERAGAVRTAIDEMGDVTYFFEPIQRMEAAALEPLPGLDDFLGTWRALVAQEARGGRRGSWDGGADKWLREVVQRVEGAEGLAKLARSSGRVEDLRAWCDALVDARSWKTALPAFEEAASIAADNTSARGEFLDGAALAAQELGRKNLSPWFERAWRGTPSMLRLRRWLGSAGSKAVLRKRVREALKACPKRAYRQRAFLLVLDNEFESAAELLSAVPGLGWSDPEHPGHVLFPLFRHLLEGDEGSSKSLAVLAGYADADAIELLTTLPDAPRIASARIADIVHKAGLEPIGDRGVRSVVLAAMRAAAEKRIAGVTEHKRRRHYGHAASLVAACLACDPSPDARSWVSDIRARHRRFTALRAELDRHLGTR